MTSLIKNYILWIILAAVSMATVIYVMWRANSKSLSSKQKLQFLLIGRYCTNAAAAFFGVLFAFRMPTSVADFPLPQPLMAVVSVIACMYTFNFLFTLIVMPAKDGLLLKGSAYTLLQEEAALEELADIDAIFTEMVFFMLLEQTRSVFQTWYKTLDKENFIFKAVEVFIAKLSSIELEHSDVQIQGIQMNSSDVKAGKFSEQVPPDFHGIMRKAIKHTDTAHLTDGSSTSIKNGISYTIEIEESSIVTLLWANKTMDAQRTLQLWATFRIFLEEVISMSEKKETQQKSSNP